MARSVFRSWIPAWICAGALGSGVMAQAQVPPADPTLDELLSLLNTPITTATRTAQSSAKAPATVVTVTADQIQRRAYRSLGEVLRDLPEFKVDNGFSVETYNAVTVRGVMGQYKFVILMDGARIGAATNEILPILENFPVHFAKQIEVVYGPASALYGADAFTGIINIVTFKGEEAERHRNYRVSYGTDGQSDAALFWSGLLGTRLHFSVGAQSFSDNMPDMPSHYPAEYQGLSQALQTGVFNTVFGPKTVNTPYEKSYQQPIRANNLFLRLQQDSWSLAVLQNYSKVPSSINYAPPNALPDPKAHVAVRTLSATANQSAEISDSLSIQSTLTARKYDVDPGSAFINLFQPNIEPGYKYAASQSFRIEEVANWQIEKSLTLTSGLSYEVADATPWSANLASPVDTGQSISSQGILVPGAPILADFYTIRSHSYGFFAQAQYLPTPQLAITLGGRWDKDSRYGSTFNPRAGLVWTPTATTTLKVMFGSAFLAPSPYAAFRHYGGFFTTDGGTTYQSSYWRLPNPGLKPEKAQTFEVSFRTFIGSSFSITTDLYRSTYKDLHTPMPDTGNTNLYGGQFKGWPVAYIEVTGNQGKQVNLGGNIQVDYLSYLSGAGKINLFASFGHVDGRVENASGFKSDIGNMTPNIGRLGFDLSLGKWSVSPIFMVVGAQRAGAPITSDPSRREEIPGYRELNVVASYTISPTWEVFLRLNNALDARYRNINENAFSGGYEFNGVPQAPRRFALGIKGTF
ncbi:MAG: TonB-dependent receptor [Holophaga sp.]|nr:TonB-dependent receptor [Holophaga sp.]